MEQTTRPTGWGGGALKALDGIAVRTPLLPLQGHEGETGILLKPEVLQPIGSFKLRGVYNWAAGLTAEQRQRGLSTASAGNTAQALGYVARLFGVPARSLLPDWVPENKLASIRRYGVTPLTVSLDDLLAYMLEEKWRQESYSYLNPWGDPMMIAGNGTIGIELIDDLPDVDTVYVPVGGGGLIAGLGGALKALKPAVRIVGVQAEACPALHAAFEAGGPVWVEARPTICEGASAPLIVDEMLPLLRRVVDEVALVSDEAAASCVRMLALGNKLVVEGAGAMSLAAALATPARDRGKTVCILSGGSIGADRLQTILRG